MLSHTTLFFRTCTASLGALAVGFCASAQSIQPVSTNGAARLSAPPCGSPTLTTTIVNGTTGPIPDATEYTPALFTATISGAAPYTWDVDVTTFLTHGRCSDITMRVISPAGTSVLLTTRNFGTASNIYNGTTWDDTGFNTVTLASWINGVGTPLLCPEGRLSAFRGENPNGTWTLSVSDGLTNFSGNLSSWSVQVRTLPAPPPETTTTFTESPNFVIPNVTTSLQTMTVSGLDPVITDVKLYIDLPHDTPQDMDIFLRSPTGTEIRITNDNGGNSDNIYAGTLFDGHATMPVTHLSVPDGVLPLLCPQGSFDNFLGEDPNGIWTIVLRDDASALQSGVGTLVRWDLIFATVSTPVVPSAPIVVAGTSGVVVDHFNPQGVNPVTFTAQVTGIAPYLWDVDLTTAITHTFNADLEMLLTSPAGTTVTITTDNGSAFDDVFAGTRWDDSVDDAVTDHVYTNLVTVPELSPEGRLAAFRGEDPNGTWTLTITDDNVGNVGVLQSWSLELASLANAPGHETHEIDVPAGLPIPPPFSPGLYGAFTIAPEFPGVISDLELFIDLTHDQASAMKIWLMAPDGTKAIVSTNNGALDAFENTLFTNHETVTVTDYPYATSPAITRLAPEGGFDRFQGLTTGGYWLLLIDHPPGVGGMGTLRSWKLVFHTCAQNGAAFCTNATLGTDHTTPCPCGNAGAAGRGCAHSFDANGARLGATGTIATDTVVLRSEFTPAASFTLFLQHDGIGDAVFHDGVLCASGTLTRLRGRAAAGGAASFPDSVFPNDATTTLSQRGGVAPDTGAVRYYSAWYRNASTTYCPPATANVSNGWTITW